MRTAVTTGPVRGALLTLALPVFGEQILNTFVGLFDTWLAGQLSAGELADAMPLVHNLELGQQSTASPVGT